MKGIFDKQKSLDLLKPLANLKLKVKSYRKNYITKKQNR